MKYTLLFLCSFAILTLNAQNRNTNSKAETSTVQTINLNRIVEDKNGHVITDLKQKVAYLKTVQDKKNAEKNLSSKPTANLIPVYLCSNSGFEEFENTSGTNVLKNFLYTSSDPENPTQCKSVDVTANQNIDQYDPAQTNLMASTVPSNFVDEFIGDIGAFDQYALKINYKNSSTTSGVVQAKRFKTNNETQVVFNYKVVLQSIAESGHLNEQPFFKARIISKTGAIISEFCGIGDPTNCIYTQAPNYDAGSIVLYTKNWQSGVLDISSISNNEEFTIEFTASRCGLGGHFGYAYIDDMCLLHSNENLQGSIELDPLYKICPTLPTSVCGKFTVPNSGGVSATVNSIILKVYDNTNNVVYTTSTTSSLDLTNKTFCFQLNATDLPNITTGNYNVSAEIHYGITQTNCAGTNFTSAIDNDANPGWDISFQNCTPGCDFTLQTATLKACDSNHDGKEFFNLTDANTQIIGTQTGLTFSYFSTLTDATNNTNPIVAFANYQSFTATVFARVEKNATCFKIIAFQLLVKNPSANISGILNVCSGSTTLKATTGVSYLWSNGATTQNIVVSSNGTYSVTVTDADGCSSFASVSILPSSVAVAPTIEVIQPTCFIDKGTITITSPAAEYSYDNGATWTTNSQMTNLNFGTYYIKIKTVNGCYSYSTPITIVPFLSSYPYYNSVNPTSCNSLGSITITTPATAYSFDDGATWTTNNTATNLPIGIYLIRTKNEFGCISNFNNVVLYGEFLQSPTYTFEAPYCGNSGSITITSPAHEYSFDGGVTWQTSNTLSNIYSGSYFLKIRTLQGCTSPNIFMSLNNFENNYPEYSIDEAGCVKYATVTITTHGDLYSFDGGNTWTPNNSLSNLNGGMNLNLQVKKLPNCISNISNITITSYYHPLPVVTNYATLICDDANNGNENVDLTNYNSNLVANSANYSFSYYTTLSGAQNQSSTDHILNFNTYNLNLVQSTIYVVVTDNNGCSSIAQLYFTLIPTPVPDLLDKYILCENSTVTIAENLLFDSYTWSYDGSHNSSIVISHPGTYTLTTTENHGSVICSTTKTFEVVLSNPAVINNFNPQDWTDYHNIITVDVTGLGNYEYSLDGLSYQDSPIFSNLDNGEYTVYVRDKNGCGVSTDDIYLLMYPKYFTPNGDGINDFWKIEFSKNEPNLKIRIFDKQAKFLKQIDTNNRGWDGNFNGKPLPATDYWFVITRQNGKEHRGHFALKR